MGGRLKYHISRPARPNWHYEPHNGCSDSLGLAQPVARICSSPVISIIASSCCDRPRAAIDSMPFVISRVRPGIKAKRSGRSLAMTGPEPSQPVFEVPSRVRFPIVFQASRFSATSCLTADNLGNAEVSEACRATSAKLREMGRTDAAPGNDTELRNGKDDIV